MQLYYRKFGDKGDIPIIILHGIFGTSDNWFSYARRLSQEGFEVFTVDQRNHGQSPHSDNFNYLAMTDDLFDFIDEHEIEDPILLGHSMGGKVAMRFALENPQLIKKLIVVDISLKAYGPRKQHKSIINAMKSVNLDTVTSRKKVEDQIKGIIPEERIRQFVLKNLHRREKNEFEWRINIGGIEKNLDQLFDGIETIEKFEKPTLFVKGGASDYILLEDYNQIRYNFPNAEIITIADASHWIHVEAPERFYQLTMGFASGNPSWYKKPSPENTGNHA
jgi:esterase